MLLLFIVISANIVLKCLQLCSSYRSRTLQEMSYQFYFVEFLHLDLVLPNLSYYFYFQYYIVFTPQQDYWSRKNKANHFSSSCLKQSFVMIITVTSWNYKLVYVSNVFKQHKLLSDNAFFKIAQRKVSICLGIKRFFCGNFCNFKGKSELG